MQKFGLKKALKNWKRICRRVNPVFFGGRNENIIYGQAYIKACKQNNAEDIFEYSSFPQVGIDAGVKSHKWYRTKEVMKEVFLDENIWGIVIKECEKVGAR